MSVFGNYSRYYDLLYKDKDYIGEAKYVKELVERFAPNAHTMLNLGCGTGAHDVLLCRDGYSIDGVDLSDEMLAKANEKISLSPDVSSSLHFYRGDIRNIRLEKSYDVVISLFHVMSYQTSNQDFEAALYTAKCHLKPNGIFIFDFWYGTGVMTNQPVVRVKRLEDKEVSIIRIAEPTLHPHKNLVDVGYTMFIINKKTSVVQQIHETHTMRYFFSPEIELFLGNSGFKMLACEEWMTKRNLDANTWNAVFVCQLAN